MIESSIKAKKLISYTLAEKRVVLQLKMLREAID